MINSQDVADYADISDASYTDFGKVPPGGISDKELFKFLTTREPNPWPKERAEEFVKNWRVVDHVIDDGSWSTDANAGFSATVFQRVDGEDAGKYVYCPRGTLGPVDFAEDLNLIVSGLAWAQIVAMYNHWQRISTPKDQTYKQAVVTPVLNPFESATIVMGNARFKITVVDSMRAGEAKVPPLTVVGVAGHSLGGHLATAFSRLFGSQVDQVLSVNGAGYSAMGYISGNTNRLFAALGGAGDFNPGNIVNLYGNRGFEFGRPCG